MLTINQIIKQLETLQSQHDQLNSFYFGDPSDVSDGAAKVYPLMGAFLQPGNLAGKQDITRLTIYFADRIEDQDQTLQREVLSDMKTLAMGVFAQFRNYLYQNSITLSPDAPFSWFNDAEWDDKCFGWQIELSITQFYSADTCQEPSTYDPQADTSGVVRIINYTTGALITTVNPGQDYPVLQFSGINDTGPPYTNSIVDNG